MSSPKMMKFLRRRSRIGQNSEQAVLQESARRDALATAKTTLTFTSQALGLLPIQIPKAISEILLKLLTGIEVSLT